MTFSSLDNTQTESSMEFYENGILSVPPLSKSGLAYLPSKSRRGENMPARLEIDTEKIVELYARGFSTIEIGRALGCSKNPVLKRLREVGMKLRERRIDLDTEKIAYLYQKGLDSRRIADMSACSKNTILRRLHECEVKVRLKTRELPDMKPGQDLACVLGVAYGDGRKRLDGLHLWVKDKDFAESFADACERLGFKPRKYFNEIEENYEVCVYSIEFGRWIKSLTFEKIEKLLVNDASRCAFVRGYFDSDGSATIQLYEKCRNGISFGDPNLTLLKFVSKICSVLGIKTSIYGPYGKGAGKEMYTLYVHAKSRRRFFELINSSLARKRDVLEKIARFYS